MEGFTMSEDLERKLYALETAATDVVSAVGDGSQLTGKQFDQTLKSILLTGERLTTALQIMRASLVRRMK
jgi:hypothetical protein